MTMIAMENLMASIAKLIQLMLLGAKEKEFGYVYENADMREDGRTIHNVTISWVTEESGEEWTKDIPT